MPLDDAIGLTALAGHLTGNLRPTADIIDVFPPKHIPLKNDANAAETLAILAQIASFEQPDTWKPAPFRTD